MIKNATPEVAGIENATPEVAGGGHAAMTAPRPSPASGPRVGRS
jgi:hypothetical protein